MNNFGRCYDENKFGACLFGKSQLSALNEFQKNNRHTKFLPMFSGI